jgi:hypothetical protein
MLQQNERGAPKAKAHLCHEGNTIRTFFHSRSDILYVHPTGVERNPQGTLLDPSTSSFWPFTTNPQRYLVPHLHPRFLEPFSPFRGLPETVPRSRRSNEFLAVVSCFIPSLGRSPAQSLTIDGHPPIRQSSAQTASALAPFRR